MRNFPYSPLQQQQNPALSIEYWVWVSTTEKELSQPLASRKTSKNNRNYALHHWWHVLMCWFLLIWRHAVRCELIYSWIVPLINFPPKYHHPHHDFDSFWTEKDQRYCSEMFQLNLHAREGNQMFLLEECSSNLWTILIVWKQPCRALITDIVCKQPCCSLIACFRIILKFCKHRKVMNVYVRGKMKQSINDTSCLWTIMSLTDDICAMEKKRVFVRVCWKKV